MFGSHSHPNPHPSKRKALGLITNIFRKKSKESYESHQDIPPPTGIDRAVTYLHEEKQLSDDWSIKVEMGSSYGDCEMPPRSPMAAAWGTDLEVLTLSRQDNPYISSTLEKLSTDGGDMSLVLSNSDLRDQPMMGLSSPGRVSFRRMSLNAPSIMSASGNESLVDEILHDNTNLHDHLIRSPPPHFPQKISEFVFPLMSESHCGDCGSPLAQQSGWPQHFSATNNSSKLSTPCPCPRYHVGVPNSLQTCSKDEMTEKVIQNQPLTRNRPTERRGSDSSIVTRDQQLSSSVCYDGSVAASSNSLIPGCRHRLSQSDRHFLSLESGTDQYNPSPSSASNGIRRKHASEVMKRDLSTIRMELGDDCDTLGVGRNVLGKNGKTTSEEALLPLSNSSMET